jgi:hypothetical protein
MCALAIEVTAPCREAFVKLRTSRTANHSFIMRADIETLQVLLEHEFPEGKSLDEIINLLPNLEPRFIVVMPERDHPDGRKSYPLIFIAYCPAGLSPQINVVYSNARTTIAREFQLQYVWEVKKKLQIGDDELAEKLATNKW